MVKVKLGVAGAVPVEVGDGGVRSPTRHRETGCGCRCSGTLFRSGPFRDYLSSGLSSEPLVLDARTLPHSLPSRISVLKLSISVLTLRPVVSFC